ncbi:MAG: hypothetical protein KatS3mg027_0835 [Bacteroidia bacterium]|nr:MAG: hypothetical protein KatS3mg027_0835 [Bacteroidia bacterium]
MKKLALFIILLWSEHKYSQHQLPRFSFKGEGGIPTSISSEAYRNTFVGEFQTGGQFVIKLFHKFYSGVGFNYALFKTSKNFQFISGNTSLPYDFFLRTHNANFTIGYFMPVEVESNKPKQFGCLELRSGYSFNKYTNVVLKVDSGNPLPPLEFTTAFLQPHLSYTFLVEENLGFGAFLNYTFYFSLFQPSYASLDKYANYAKWKNNFNISWITLGLHFHWYFIKVQKEFD